MQKPSSNEANKVVRCRMQKANYITDEQSKPINKIKLKILVFFLKNLCNFEPKAVQPSGQIIYTIQINCECDEMRATCIDLLQHKVKRQDEALHRVDNPRLYS